MLEEKDILIFEKMLSSYFNQSEKALDEKLDSRFAQSEKALDEKLDSRFAQSEKALDEKLDSRFALSEKALDEKLDSRFAQSEKTLDEKLDSRFAQSENLILGELERVRLITDQKIEQVQSNLDEIKQYYRITKLENDNTALFLQMLHDLQTRVEHLEQQYV